MAMLLKKEFFKTNMVTINLRLAVEQFVLSLEVAQNTTVSPETNFQ